MEAMNQVAISQAPPLERYVRILEVLAASRNGVSASELGGVLGLPRATIHRLLKGMIDTGIVEPATGSRYRLGDRIRHLAVLGADERWYEPVLRPILREVVESTGLTSYISKLDGIRVVGLMMESPEDPWRGYVLPGRDFAPHAAASAKAVLAYQPPAVIERALLDSGLERLTAHTIVDQAKILEDYDNVRRSGYATCIGEIDEELVALAVPIPIHGLAVSMSLGVTTSLLRLSPEQLPDMADRLKPFAARIGAMLGKRPL
jgi:DNA-binding IclR family transcriptional regulator